MDSDALIEQLAFGKTTPRMSSCLGLYLSPETIYLSEVRLSSGKPVVDHLVRVPVPIMESQTSSGTTPPATLNTDFLNDPAKVSALVRQAMSQLRWNSKNVIVTLSHHLGLLRYFVMPQIDRKFWPAAVPVEAKKYIPIPFDALNHDFQILGMPPGADGKPRQGALIAVTPRRNMPNIEALLKSLDLQVMGLEVAPCSVTRLLHGLQDGNPLEPFSQVHFDGGNIRILVSEKGLPVFFREIFLGPESSPSDSRKVDIAGCVGFAQKQLAVGKLSDLRVSGACPEFDAWKEVLSQESGLPASHLDFSARLGIKGGDWGGFASVGAALRYLSEAPITIDLSGIGRISDSEKKTARDIFVLTGVLSAVLALAGLYNNMVYGWKARELAQYKKAPELEAAFTGKKPEEIEKMLALMQDQFNNLAVMETSSRLKVSEILRELAEALPEKTWLSRITVVNPIRGGGGSRELNLVGNAVGASTLAEQDLAFLYRDRLSKSPVISRNFPDLQVAVQFKTIAAEALKTMPQEALKRALEERTEFRITGKSKRRSP